MMNRNLLSEERLGPLFYGIVCSACEGWLVGGSVRDLMLGRNIKDLDIVVEGDPEPLARRLAEEFGGRLGARSHFGTQALVIEENRIDLATARCESYAEPAALPEVKPAGLEEDLLRRDFTVNSMALDLHQDSFGKLVDPRGGQFDLKGKLIRVLHDRSFVDDPTRMYRAVRFATRLGFEMAEETAGLMGKAIAEGMVERLSPARLGREVKLALAEKQLYDVSKMMRDNGLWNAIDGRFRIRAGDLRRLRLIERWVPDRWIMALVLLTVGWEADELRRLAKRLQLNRNNKKTLLRAMSEARRVTRSLAPGVSLKPGRVYTACRDCLESSIFVARLLTTSQKTAAALNSYLKDWTYGVCDIDGSDLVAAGIPEGPAVAAGLQAAVVAKLNGEAETKQEQLQVALREARACLTYLPGFD
jgi:tRNA nucleotidyltransferase (CCA-adding enzyme)